LAITEVRFFFELGMGLLICFEDMNEESVALEMDWSCLALVLMVLTSPDDPGKRKNLN
jgi:hypothetical protein